MDTLQYLVFALLTTAASTGVAWTSSPGPSAASRMGRAQTQCDVRREVTRELDAAELSGVILSAGAGSLRVTGTPSPTIRVSGVVCASDEDLADEARLVMEPRRGAAWIEADLPDGDDFWDRGYVRMDLTVEMPASFSADLRDGSGGVEVSGIAGVRIDDGSGSIVVENIGGRVEIEDGSGDVQVRGAGMVEIDDGSGGIEIVGVRGDVHVSEDGSGEIDIRDVTGSVRIDEDGSGSIDVAGVGGDLVVEDDGSGSLRYRDVQGQVRVPDAGR
jgi:hypothetical protein